MVKNCSDIQNGNLLPPLHWQRSFYIDQPTNRIAHIAAFVTLAGMRNSSMGPLGGIDPATHHALIRHSAMEHIYEESSNWHFEVFCVMDVAAVVMYTFDLFLHLQKNSKSCHLEQDVALW